MARHRRVSPSRGAAVTDRRFSARRTWWWPYVVIAVLVVLLLAQSAGHGGFTATVANVGDQSRSGSLLTAATSGGTTECDLGTQANNPIATANTAACSGTLAPSLPTGTGSAATSTTVTEKGSVAVSSAALTGGNCGPVQLANAATSSDPMLVRGSTPSYAQSGPLTGSTGLGLSGSSAFAADVTKVTAPTAGFSELIWFKAPSGTTSGGTMMGFANTPSAYSPGQWDRMIWLDNTGHVVFGAYNSAVYEATTTTKYNDGAWHLAVATVSSTAGMSLYVDSAAAVTNVLNRAAESDTGYWHVGWDNVTSGWTNPPTNAYFTGTLADAAVIPSVLTSAQVSSLYSSGTQTTWASRLAALAPTNSWTLGDDGTSPYTGTVPSVSAAACDYVDVTVSTTAASTACAYPSSPSGCGAPSTGSRLSGLANASRTFAVYPTPGQTLTVTVTVQRDTANTAPNSYAAGLHLTMPLTITCNAGGGSFSATLTWPAEDLQL